MKRIPAGVLIGLVLAGCGGPAATTHRAPSATEPSVKAAPRGTAAVERHPAPAVAPTVTVSITCDFDHTYSSYRDAWPGKFAMCDGTAIGTMDATQAKAVSVANDAAPDRLRVLGALYGVCAESGADAWSFLSLVTPDLVGVVRGALILCPDHPDRNLINKLLAVAGKHNRQEADGRIFGEGEFRVGHDIKPGSYYAEDVENCFWERTDVNRKPIADNFTERAKLVRVTIRPSDYSFISEGCGQWQPQS
ncbi:hypothetical protein [Peterkaempfera sp. SMS 1(5)a]|uniref:hypothetical protein n=1 Tax=Peterkaempfera podocarpi TaxID=3232308 RepID=UPI00366DF40D